MLSVGLFAAVLLHELGHALMALKTGGRVRQITLMLLGGMTEIDHEDARPRHAFAVAIAGPAVNLVLGAASLILSGLLRSLSVDAYLFLLLFGGINLLLTAFNLIPAFPLMAAACLKPCCSGNCRKKRRMRSPIVSAA